MLEVRLWILSPDETIQLDYTPAIFIRSKQLTTPVWKTSDL